MSVLVLWRCFGRRFWFSGRIVANGRTFRAQTGGPVGKEVLQLGLGKIRRVLQRGGVAPRSGFCSIWQALVVRLTSKLILDRMKLFFVQYTVVSSTLHTSPVLKFSRSLVLWPVLPSPPLFSSPSSSPTRHRTRSASAFLPWEPGM